jgi:hypothetical protein
MLLIQLCGNCVAQKALFFLFGAGDGNVIGGWGLDVRDFYGLSICIHQFGDVLVSLLVRLVHFYQLCFLATLFQVVLDAFEHLRRAILSLPVLYL